MPMVAWIWLDRQRRRKRFDKAQRIYTDAGLVGSAEKDVVNSEVAKVVGAELDSSIETRSLDLITLELQQRSALRCPSFLWSSLDFL